ncbi:hypothetical protein CQ007_03210 [Pseudomonas sp. MYb185]|nr:hypothetical protein CQ007_03210 [Pseudomonas sp. MYb185]
MKRIKQRLITLEQASTSGGQRITRIELVNAMTGKVGAVIHIGGPESDAEVLQVLTYKHETDPPRKHTPAKLAPPPQRARDLRDMLYSRQKTRERVQIS